MRSALSTPDAQEVMQGEAQSAVSRDLGRFPCHRSNAGSVARKAMKGIELRQFGRNRIRARCFSSFPAFPIPD